MITKISVHVNADRVQSLMLLNNIVIDAILWGESMVCKFL